MAWFITRRLPLTTYQPVAKRQRIMVKRTTRILLLKRNPIPEIKQWISAVNLITTLNGAYVTIPIAMSQGDDGNDFIGFKFRVLRVRIYYDYSTVTVTDFIRMVLGVPKDPS